MPVDVQKPTKRSGTRDRILATAERLFAEYGYDGVSLRQIGAAADAQIALINYHFGTKEMLYRAVFESRIKPLSERRRTALEAALSGAAGPATVEGVLDALARPWIEMHGTKEGHYYTRLIAREGTDPREAERGIVRDLLDPVARDFIQAMERVLQEHHRSDIHLAYHFFVSTLQLILTNPGRIERLSGDLLDHRSTDAIVRRLVGFVAAALNQTPP